MNSIGVFRVIQRRDMGHDFVDDFRWIPMILEVHYHLQDVVMIVVVHGKFWH